MNDANESRFVGRSDGGLVEAEVDQLARVVDIRITRQALTRCRGSELSAHVLQAVNTVREQARAGYRDGRRR